MADEKITREVYKGYADKIVSVLKGEGFYEQFKKRVDKGSSSFKLAKKRLIQDISIDWIDTIEGILPNLDTIVRNPRKFIVQEEDIVDVSLARSISTESVKYLAQHTNMISKVEKDGSVTPSKILNITKEESFEIYENRFIYTLLLKLKDFVTMRYDKIKKASATQDVLELDLESRFNLPSKKVTYRAEYFAQLSFDEVMRLDPDTLSKIERVAKIDRIITDFLSSSFAKSMRNSAPVRPPIMRTNVILKEPNFKKALTLWQFVETYNATAGFSTSDDVEDLPIEKDSNDRLRDLVTLNSLLFESLYEQCETNLDAEDAKFADFLRVGEMDFQKDEISRDEYAQKLENEIENEDEQDRVEEVKPQDSDQAQEELPPETPQEPEKEEVEKEIEKEVEIEREVEVIREVEVEKFKELVAKEEQNEIELEPDADTFDNHLFEVRKVFKRPDGDKIKQEEVAKARDAIDRCLNTYRRIKQEELEERDRQDRIRRRREDVEKRAAAFRKERGVLDTNAQDATFYGVDPFSEQRAKIEAKRKEEEKAAQIKLDKSEKLDLEDADVDSVKKSIEQMEEENARRDERNAQIDKNLDSIDALMPILDGEQPVQTKKKAQKPAKSESVEPEQVFEEAPKKGDEPLSDPPKSAKPKIRLAKEQEIDPWGISPTTANQKYSKPSGKQKNIDKVDEGKVAVGDIRINSEEEVNPWGESANLGKLDKSAPSVELQQAEPAPKKKRTPKPKLEEPKEAEQAEQKTAESVQESKSEEPKAESKQKKPRAKKVQAPEEQPAEPQAESKPKIRLAKESSIDPWGISPTTANQKYSKPSGKQKNIEKVDENKVSVGDIHLSQADEVNPWGESVVAPNSDSEE